MKWLYTLWRFEPDEAYGNDSRWHEPPQKWQALRRLGERLLQGFDDVLFNQREMMNNLGNAPFILGRRLMDTVVIDCGNEVKQLAVNRVEFGKGSVHGNSDAGQT